MSTANPDILDLVMAMREQRRPYAIATVVEVTGSASAKPGSKALIDAHGDIVAGWVGGGCAEAMVCREALKSLRSGEPLLFDVDLDSETLGVGMPCGGAMLVFVEPVLPRPALWIMGHGRVCEVMCHMGSLQGFEVNVIDPKADPARYLDARRLVTDDPDYAQLQPGPDDFVVVATQHKGDHRSIRHALRSATRYVAMIASVKRSRLVLDHLAQEGFSTDDLARVRAPAGIDLGARTPEEIALSILCEIVMVRRRGSGGLMCEQLADRSGHTGPSPVSAIGNAGTG